MPPLSPDFNWIENVWHVLDMKIRKKKIYRLEQTCHKLIESIPRRLQVVIESKGMHTKY